MRIRTTLPLLLAAALAVPATAAADSIVYIDGGDVWSARPDGSGKVRLTDGARWHSVTQADDGTIAAVDGLASAMTVMSRDGRPLRTIDTTQMDTPSSVVFDTKPTDLAFLPDGRQLSYMLSTAECGSGGDQCGAKAVFTTAADVAVATPLATGGDYRSGASTPAWVTNERLLTSGGYGRELELGGPREGPLAPVWSSPGDYLSDAEISRDGRRLAAVSRAGSQPVLAFYATSAAVLSDPAPPAPTPSCRTTSGDAELASPSWSPDGSRLAAQSSDGIEVVALTVLESGHCETAGGSVLTPTGSHPDWGPADPPAARWIPTQPRGPDTPPTRPQDRRAPGGGVVRDGPVGRAVQVRLPSSALRRSDLARGRARLKLTVTAPGTVRVTLLAGRRKVAVAKPRRVAAAGKLTVALPRVKTSLRGRRTLTVVAELKTKVRTVQTRATLKLR
ncbi:hypothetical protein Q5424_25935 [Conexibacter sp. JD483]|uniref:hypothetical protein n=1 Tax=unclassified Conexibacter TaxID=2627773 RepID=UPI00271B8332|nr:MULTISPECIES: hypothetical protein [unclassified Conexibacter]MDO8187782.1 hypothetical protein [Conexibacter sp. CPCC 205706]MDO8201970.1 hypothetical protein [Conexibacter sp. CPCC 205762]MDR9372566.1 hypothetical protein [Conexibacter sp. JD483]